MDNNDYKMQYLNQEKGKLDVIRHSVIAALFLVFAVYVCVGTELLLGLSEIVESVLPDSFISKEDMIVDTDLSGEIEEINALVSVSERIEKTFPLRQDFIDLNGIIMKTCGVRSYYNDTLRITLSSQGYIIGQYAQTSTDYEIEQMDYLKTELTNRGIRLLYVNEPVKYFDDAFCMEEIGKESYVNRNMDLFLNRLDEIGVEYIDLREEAKADGMEALEMFYRTDHHWTVPAAFWAAGKIAERLNCDYGYHIDMDLYNESNFNITEYRECWLGEQGQKTGAPYVGLDDFVLIEPAFETHFRYHDEIEGSFSDVFIDKGIYDSPYTDENRNMRSWHYSYKGRGIVHNYNVDGGNILVLGDSYEMTLMPFLELGVEDANMIILRSTDENVMDIIDNGDYDTVIIAYAQSMLGEHDNPNSANYRMFQFKAE